MGSRVIFFLITPVFILFIIGLITLYSTSIFDYQIEYVSQYSEARKQVIWFIIGLCACVCTSLIDYRVWKKYSIHIYIFSSLLLILCFLPGIGVSINGERRWISIFKLQIQPSEISKIAIVFFISFWLSRNVVDRRKVINQFLIPLFLVCIPLSFILSQVDIGTSMVIYFVVLLIFFISGVNWKYLLLIISSSIVAFVLLIKDDANRVNRIIAFLDLEKYSHGVGFQQWISQMAIGSGGIFGRGLGESRLKMSYLPFSNTDFIFPIISEEMGLIVSIIIVILFLSLVISGFVIAVHSEDKFGFFLAIGLVSYIGIQAFLNISVSITLLPNTGISLPFVSYGGSSLITALLSVGILINIYRQGNYKSLDNINDTFNKRLTPRL